MNFETLLNLADEGTDLSIEQMERAIEGMLTGQIPDDMAGRLLLSLREKGESVSELVGAALAMRRAMTAVKTRRTRLLDTCGTGGDGAKTFNISTAAAIVAAAAGANVAKHGNRKITSATGSADVLSELGIKVDASREVVERCLDEIGICFCFAPMLHPAMKHVAQVRRSLAVPTLFNYLGPLCNPAGAEYQLLGVGREALHEKIAKALTQLPIRGALVVRGLDGMDEVTLNAPTSVYHIVEAQAKSFEWTHADFGMKPIDMDSLRVETPVESAAVIRSVLEGTLGGPRDMVLANAAAGIWLVGLESSLKQAVHRCAAAIDSGQAGKKLNELVRLSQCRE
jgi:anthranilate phosphoribosyltransferase